MLSFASLLIKDSIQKEVGARKQKAADKKRQTGNGRQKAADKRQQTEGSRQKADKRHHTESSRQKATDKSGRQKTAVGRRKQQAEDSVHEAADIAAGRSKPVQDERQKALGRKIQSLDFSDNSQKKNMFFVKSDPK